jgi:hypothetical protein
MADSETSLTVFAEVDMDSTFPDCGSVSQSRSESCKIFQRRASTVEARQATRVNMVDELNGRWIKISRSWVLLNEIDYQCSANWWFFVMLTLSLTVVINCR